jgi:adenylate cyclase
MTEEGFKRKLTAILCADVKGYSILMADDEVATMQTLKDYRKNMTMCIEQHGGRVVDAVGDNLLAEFGSAVDAVHCAAEVQKELKAKNQELPEDKRLKFRIGINIGDVIQDGDRIFGDGVNVAARIEGIADPGGVCISRNAYDHVKDKLELGFEFIGEHEVKNIKEPVRVYKVLLDSDSPTTLVIDSLELPDIPSIAVLPFVNMSGDANQEYFSDGLTEQIIMGLSKVSNLFVIARNSTFTYKGKSVKVQQVGKELGVNYVLEGSVQRAADRVRITAQLIDAITGYHLWAESYDRELTDIFALQDEITFKLITAMEVKLTRGEQALLQEKAGTTSIVAYDKYWRGWEYFFSGTEQDIAQARKLVEEAISLDKEYALAYVLLGATLWSDIAIGKSKSPFQDLEEVEKCAFKALKLNDSLDMAHILLGNVYLTKRQHQKAVEAGKKAVALNPNGADAHAMSSYFLIFSGKPEKAIELLKRAFRLNPFPPHFYFSNLGIAYRENGQYLEAIETCRKSININPYNWIPYGTLAASYSFLEQYEKAHETVKELLKINPKVSIEFVAMVAPFEHKADLENLLEALRKAGLPEHSPKE